MWLTLGLSPALREDFPCPQAVAHIPARQTFTTEFRGPISVLESSGRGHPPCMCWERKVTQPREEWQVDAGSRSLRFKTHKHSHGSRSGQLQCHCLISHPPPFLIVIFLKNELNWGHTLLLLLLLLLKISQTLWDCWKYPKCCKTSFDCYGMCHKLRLAYSHISRILFTPLFNPHKEIPPNYNVIFLREHKQKLFCFPLKSTAEIQRADVSGRPKKADILCSMLSKSLNFRIIFISL